MSQYKQNASARHLEVPAIPTSEHTNHAATYYVYTAPNGYRLSTLSPCSPTLMPGLLISHRVSYNFFVGLFNLAHFILQFIFNLFSNFIRLFVRASYFYKASIVSEQRYCIKHFLFYNNLIDKTVK